MSSLLVSASTREPCSCTQSPQACAVSPVARHICREAPNGSRMRAGIARAPRLLLMARLRPKSPTGHLSCRRRASCSLSPGPRVSECI